MNDSEVHRLVSEGSFPGSKMGVELLETHASWVILTGDYAFKIKKPVRFAFLDFSTLELRRHFLLEELYLNQRLAPHTYLRVLPIGRNGIGLPSEPLLDYALQMRRMDNTRQMDKLLQVDAVSASDVQALAALLAAFHQQHRLPTDFHHEVEEDLQDFADLYALEADLRAAGVDDAEMLHRWEARLPPLLECHAQHMAQRIGAGWWVEGHGDLHGRNIFLPTGQPPVVFDCLEFSARLRRMDVLNELAFLCMDLEHFGRPDLADAFLHAYIRHWPCMKGAADVWLFVFYKAYRANVRLKVSLLEWRQQPSEVLRERVAAYWLLLKAYAAALGVS